MNSLFLNNIVKCHHWNAFQVEFWNCQLKTNKLNVQKKYDGNDITNL